MHTHDEQFAQWKPLVDSLVRAQQQLCNRFLKEAEDLIRKLNHPDEAHPLAQKQNAQRTRTRNRSCYLFRVKTGQPKSEGLMKVLENPEYAQDDEPGRTGRCIKDQKKVDLYREKEELLFAIDEKSHEADLTEKGRNFVSPKDPDAFVLPDLNTMLHDVDAGAETDARKAAGGENKIAGRSLRRRRRRFTRSRNCSRRIRFTSSTWNMSCRKTRSSSLTSTRDV